MLNKETQVAFAKTHKTGSSTLQNIFFRWGTSMDVENIEALKVKIDQHVKDRRNKVAIDIKLRNFFYSLSMLLGVIN